MEENKTIPTLEEMFAQLQEQKGTMEKQAKTISLQQAAIEGMKMKETNILVAKVKKLEIPAKTVQIGGKEYQWTVPHFIYKTVKITAEDASLDDDILKQIIAIPGQGILKELA